jgi:primosomal replication protein N
MTITKQIKSVLPFKVGAVVELTGKVTKRVRREGECKLVIEPGDVPGFVVFADCPGELENLTKLNIRKGSLVSVRGKFLSYGAKAVCLSDCRLEQVGTLSANRKKKRFIPA